MREAERIENLRSAAALAAAGHARARSVHEVFDEHLEELAPRPTLGAGPNALHEVEAEIERLDDELRTTRLELEGLRQQVFTTHMELSREMHLDGAEDPLHRRAEEVRTLEAIRAGLVTLRDELKR